MRLTSLFFCLMLGIVSIGALAQDSTSDTEDKAASRTITGCLQKSDSGDGFKLVANDTSSTWEVMSSQVNLADHVGHMVNVTGVVETNNAHNLKEDAKEVSHDTEMKKDHRERGHLTVTDVQMVSASCSQ